MLRQEPPAESDRQLVGDLATLVEVELTSQRRLAQDAWSAVTVLKFWVWVVHGEGSFPPGFQSNSVKAANPEYLDRFAVPDIPDIPVEAALATVPVNHLSLANAIVGNRGGNA